MHKALIVSALGCFLISGCADRTQPTEVLYRPVDRPTIVLPELQPLRMESVEWQVITDNNASEVLDALSYPPVLFALTAEGYENLSTNINELRSYIAQQQSLIAAYRQYYTTSQAALTEANRQLSQ